MKISSSPPASTRRSTGIILRIDVYVSILLPGYSTVTQVSNEITVAETVIVGAVPETYTYFSTTPDVYEDDAKDYILNKD